MLSRRTAFFALILTLGCSSDERDVTGVPAPSDDEPLSLAGTYRATTPYQTTVEELGAGSTAIDYLIELKDPSVLLADEIADESGLPDEIVTILVEEAVGDKDQDIEDAIAGVLEETIEWELESRLTISDDRREEARSGLTLTHYAELLRTTIDGEEREFELDKPAQSEMPTADVTFDEPRVTLKEHTVVLDDLTMLGAILETRLAPAIAPGTDNINDALLEVIDCDGLSNEISKSACVVGVGKVADEIVDRLGQLRTFDVNVTLVGRGQAEERTGDSRVDTIEGTWFTQFHEDGVTVDAPLEARR